jgi:opacity protein-like surface antigen
MNRFYRLLLVGVALVFMAPAVAAPTLTFKFSGVNIPGAAHVQAYGISEAGEIVGEYIGSDSIPHGFTLKGKTVTAVNDPKGLATLCQGISPSGGAIVGYYINSMGKNFGYLLKGKHSPMFWVRRARPPALLPESMIAVKSWASTRTRLS